MSSKIDDMTRERKILPEFEFQPRQQQVTDDRMTKQNNHQRRTESHQDTLEFRSYIQQVDKQMKEMEERLSKQVGSLMEELNFKVLEVKLKQEQGSGKNQLRDGGPVQNQGLDPKKLENALNDWLQKVEV